ncbi:hypothetical protein [Streptomyces pinistramenti]|uniref:hypothetical protein n=1 Tax=Streptomyces pinistramenti TaxID=2884812 RepID=UPI001D069A30|nr:hypothetical protein [Streptomyces pinistramenti]MCB5908379.1 hypothetical protein [Streptomyces pinistramenti]
MSSYRPVNPQHPEPPGSPLDPADEARIAATDQIGDELLESKTARQDAVTEEIYEQLRAGSEVDDIKHLIAKLSRVATEDAADRQNGPRSGSGRP